MSPRTTLRVTIEAPAKLNLLLAVGSRRSDGYHEIVSVMQTLDLADRLDIDLQPGIGDVDVLVEAEDLPGGDTLVTRAVSALLERVHGGGRCWVTIDKYIPVAAGLGGGSSDAAAALVAVNRLLGHPLQQPELHDIAASLGSDVPFFLLRQGTAIVTGRGERIQRVVDLPSRLWLLCNPGIAVSTAEVYRHYRPEAAAPLPDAAQALSLAAADEPRNDLAAPALALCPPLARLVQALRDAGATPLVAGSGATVAVPLRSPTDRAAFEAVARQAAPGCWTRRARTQ